jgi:hypothetical protein
VLEGEVGPPPGRRGAGRADNPGTEPGTEQDQGLAAQHRHGGDLAGSRALSRPDLI